MDLLGGLDLSGSASLSAPVMAASAPTAKPSTGVDLLGDLFGSGPASAATAAVAPVVAQTFAPIKCYEKNGLVVTLTPFKELPTLTQIKAVFTSFSGSEISNILFQVALPKVAFFL